MYRRNTQRANSPPTVLDLNNATPSPEKNEPYQAPLSPQTPPQQDQFSYTPLHANDAPPLEAYSEIPTSFDRRGVKGAHMMGTKTNGVRRKGDGRKKEEEERNYDNNHYDELHVYENV